MILETAIFALQLLHSLVFFFVAGLVLYTVRYGVTGKGRAGWVVAGFAVPAGVGALWVINGRECVISSAIYELSGSRETADIFLPGWFARRIMLGTTMVVVASFVGCVTRAWMGRRGGKGA